MKRNIIRIIASSFLFLSAQGIAATENLNFTVKVTIYQKVCSINDNNPINVNFGDMIIKDVNGVNYERPINYDIKCDDGDDNPALKLRFENNTGAVFDRTLLRTSDLELGLRIKANNNKLNLGDWVPFSFNSPPSLTATPVPSGAGGINDGALTASALLTVEYQ